MELFDIGFITFRLLDLLDILIVAWLLYKLYRLLKGGVAMNILIGILTIYFLWWLFVKVLDMQLLGALLGQFIGVGVLALIIVFQQELRRFLIFVGTNSIFTKGSFLKNVFTWKWQLPKEVQVNIQPIVKACATMSKTKTGALIVISRNTDLNLFEGTGDLMEADISKRLLESIFFKNSPLHDGAVIVSGNRIKAARCVLPVTDSLDVPAHYGMRHRAALGISEQSDAIAIAVSEETGAISMAVSGVLYPHLQPDELEKKLTVLLT
jgi:uncharacterized protein (TIGR00159 family)